MTRIKIYLEGGGDYKEQKAALRQGISSFLDSLKQIAADKGIGFDIVICGGRQWAYEAFKNALEKEAPTTLAVLLVDAEESVVLSPRQHLATRDGWTLDAVDEDLIHLMTQLMETWIIADPEAVQSYYAQGFVACLPKSDDLEQIPKGKIEELLKRATKHTRKKEYHKTKHAPDLLGRIDEAKVRHRCGFCNRLFNVLQTRIRHA